MRLRSKSSSIWLTFAVALGGANAHQAGAVAESACANVLDLGDARDYWNAFRKERAQLEPDLIRQMQAEIPSVPKEEALHHLVSEYMHRFGDSSGCKLGWPRPDQFRGTAETAVLVSGPLPLLAEPNFGQEHLSVLAIVGGDSYFPVLQTVTNGVRLQSWTDARPSDDGDWVQLATTSGPSGWLYLQPGATRIVEVPRPAPHVNDRDAPATTGNFVPAIALLALAFTMGVAFLARSRSARRSAPISYASDTYQESDQTYGDSDDESYSAPDVDEKDSEDEAEPSRGRHWSFASKCANCGSVDHASDDCPHGFFASECRNCGSKNHSTSDCPHGFFSEKCTNCGSADHSTDDCPHGWFATACANCGSKNHATDDCPHGMFATECANCGSKEHATDDCPH